MSLEVETIVAVSVMMAVFSAVAAVGTSIVLGAGFERLRCGFEVIRKQTGFFSDAIHKLEQKVGEVDMQTNSFSQAIAVMEGKVSNFGDQTNAFTECVQKLERKVEIVDKQAGFFGDAIHKLEQKVESVGAHEDFLNERMAQNADADLISVGKTEALVTHAEDLLTRIGVLAEKMSDGSAAKSQSLSPDKLMHYMHFHRDDGGNVSYN